MKIEKAQIIKSLMNVQKNPHTNNIINSQIDVVINQLIQTDSIECVFSKQSYLRSNLENKVVLSPTSDFGFYHFVKTDNHIDKNGNVCGFGCPGADIEDGPYSVEDVIDNIKEESL